MKLIVGLGNPEKRYADTRHNAGWMVLDRVASRHSRGSTPRAAFHAMVQEAGIGGEKCLLARPLTHMNRSGLTVSEALSFYKLDAKKDLLVIVDDLYLAVGAMRVKPGGDGGHNGLSDIRRALGHDDYPRLRVGVGLSLAGGNAGKPPEWDQADFVLSTFSEDEKAALAPALDRAADACEVFATRGLDAAMNQFNSDPSKARPKKPRPDGPDSPKETKNS